MRNEEVRRVIYDQLRNEAGDPVWRLPFGIAFKTGLDPEVVVQFLQSDPNIMVSNLSFAGRTAYTLKPEAPARL